MATNEENREFYVGIIILAAGASTRMGTPKQLLMYKGRSLVRHTVEVALASMCRPVVVVTGANAEIMKPELLDLPIKVVENQQWSKGMSSSIRVGLEGLKSFADNLDAAVILLCDQPFVSAQLINQILAKYLLTGLPIVACEYAQTLGVPALFSHVLFPELSALQDSVGAKQIIKKYFPSVASVSFPEGKIDIDIPLDYENLQII